MNEIQLRDGLFELFPPDGASDWEDVLRRAASPRRVRRLTLLLVAAFLVVLAIGSALALSGRLGGLFHGTLVNDLTPRERFLLTELDMNGKVELIARRNSSACSAKGLWPPKAARNAAHILGQSSRNHTNELPNSLRILRDTSIKTNEDACVRMSPVRVCGRSSSRSSGSVMNTLVVGPGMRMPHSVRPPRLIV